MLCKRGYTAEGVEMDSKSAQWGRANYGVTIHITALNESPYEEGSLDALLLMDVLEHSQNPLIFLTEIKTLLRPGGIVLVSFPDIRSLESRYWHFLSRLFRRNWLWQNCHIPLHVWEFTEPTAAAVFHKAGFKIEEFNRTQAPLESVNTLFHWLLRLPTLPLYWGPIKKIVGSQMEFVIRKE
jgi:2-polyprenyl-3-methyl-5-hydroxy-6-metoxy-1,4-benzoquinol methylase